MSNKKRIRKLLQAKYKPSRKVVYFDKHKFGYEFGKAAGNAARQLSLVCKALTKIMAGVRINTGRTWGKTDFIKKEYLDQLKTTSRADFQRQYMNDPIQTGVVHKAVVFIDGNLPEKELAKIVDKLEKKRINKIDPI